MKVQRVHFNRQAATLRVMPRRKGKGHKGETIPLLLQAVDALQAFFDAKAEGAFSTASFYQRWKTAKAILVRELQKQVASAGGNPSTVKLARFRPYDLRHSFLTEIYRRSRDPKAVMKLGLHANFSTSERYIEGAVDESAQRAIEMWTSVPAGASRP